MKISTKPTIYIIDGLNFIKSFLKPSTKEMLNQTEQEFFDWLEELSSSQEFSQNEIRVILDGHYRDVGNLHRGKVKISFSDDLTADDLILEQAVYLFGNEERVAVVTSDRELAERCELEGVRVLSCKKFFNLTND